LPFYFSISVFTKETLVVEKHIQPVWKPEDYPVNCNDWAYGGELLEHMKPASG
jgi:hypothetical protein